MTWSLHCFVYLCVSADIEMRTVVSSSGNSEVRLNITSEANDKALLSFILGILSHVQIIRPLGAHSVWSLSDGLQRCA